MTTLISISGPSGSGKTTAANLASRLSGAVVVHGDTFIRENSDDLMGLKHVLEANSQIGAAVIFEHVSAFRVLSVLNIEPQMSVFLCPESPVYTGLKQLRFTILGHRKRFLRQLDVTRLAERTSRETKVATLETKTVDETVKVILTCLLRS